MHYIVKFFPEITIKSRPVRRRMSQQLYNNLRKLCGELDGDITLRRDWEKIDLWTSRGNDSLREDIENILRQTPGIAKFSRVLSFPLLDLPDLLAKTKEYCSERLDGKTFSVRVKRRGDHSFRSVDVERFVGAGLLADCNPAGVRLEDPQVVVGIEIRGDQFHLIEASEAGLGGFPLGSQDAVLSLISGGFDSTVASYLTMKRGLLTHFLFFNLGGRAHELGVKEVAYYLWKKYGGSHPVQFVTVPFEAVVSEILSEVDNAYMGVVLKRAMLRAANAVAQTLPVGALVTGESVSQVSSQTLANLGVIDEASELLTLRPLAMMDKGAIIQLSREIGAEAFAANMPEYCGIISVRPTTRAKRERVLHEESKLDSQTLDKALASRRVETIDALFGDDENQPVDAVEVHPLPPPGAVVIDIRHPDEIHHKPLKAGKVQVMEIPFFELDKHFHALDQDLRFLLYCDRGMMSRLHAELLYEKGFRNIGVYRPPSR